MHAAPLNEMTRNWLQQTAWQFWQQPERPLCLVSQALGRLNVGWAELKAAKPGRHKLAPEIWMKWNDGE